jgi:uncharacterized membrane protein YjfL (UPF0719 family)
MNYTNIALNIGNLILILGAFYIFRAILENTVWKNNTNREFIEADNLGLGFQRIGVILGFFIGSLGVIDSTLELQALNVSLLIIFMIISILITDYMLLKNVNNVEAIKEGNTALGLLEGSIYLGTGLIAFSSFNGTGPWYSSIVFFILGQLVFIVVTKIYNITHKDIIHNIEENKNMVASIILSGAIIAIALITNNAISGDFTNWKDDLISFSVYLAYGLIAIKLFGNFIINKLFYPFYTINEALENNNKTFAILITSFQIGVALLIVNII